MNKFVIDRVEINNNLVSINFTPSQNIQQYFNENYFYLEYGCDISTTPKSLAVVPLIANILPMAWFTDTEIIVDELDEDFYNSLENIKAGYIDMVPHMSYKGKVTAKKLVKNEYLKNNDSSLLFFSGGVDAYYSYTKHYNEHLELFSVWGSDIALNEENGWNILKNLIEDNFNKENRDIVKNYVKSNFRDCLNYATLGDLVKDSLDDYWHGFQHGIGIISLATPILYIKGIKNIYFASTYTLDNLDKPCASRPSIDEAIKIAQTSVVHDGIEANRLQKVLNIVKFYKGKPNPKIHICWEQQSGLNCGVCNKCIRTMMELLCAEASPNEYGIPFTDSTIALIKQKLLDGSLKLNNLDFYKEMQDYIVKNKRLLKNNSVNWMLDIDLATGQYVPKPQKLSFCFRVKRKIKHILKKILKRQ